jgi:hypothetical protein
MAIVPGSAMGQPIVYSNIQEWNDAGRSFQMIAKTSIVCNDDNYEALQTELLLFCEDMETFSGQKLKLSKEDADRGDIQFILAEDIDKIGKEGYLLDIGKSAVVQANTTRGIFYGMQKLLQLFKQDIRGSQGQDS